MSRINPPPHPNNIYYTNIISNIVVVRSSIGWGGVRP